MGDRSNPDLNTSCTSSFVYAIWHGNCSLKSFLRFRNEKCVGSSSPGCNSILEKSRLLPSILGGVPVFIRPLSNPKSISCSVIPVDALSPARPPPNCFSPMCIKPFKKVPFVRTTAFPLISEPKAVLTPTHLPPSTITPTTESCQKSNPSVRSNISRQVCAKRYLSFCVLGLHIAGPLDLFSILN